MEDDEGGDRTLPDATKSGISGVGEFRQPGSEKNDWDRVQ